MNNSIEKLMVYLRVIYVDEIKGDWETAVRN